MEDIFSDIPSVKTTESPTDDVFGDIVVADNPAARAELSATTQAFGDKTRGSFLDPFVKGALFGWGPEMSGAIRGLIAAAQGDEYGNAYDEEVARRERDLAAYEDRHPIVSVGSEIAGGVGTGLGLAGKGLTLFRPGMSLGKATLAGMGEGALYGAVAGAGNAEEGERLEDAVTGGGTGALVGAAAPTIAKGVGAVAKGLMDKFRTSPGQRQVLKDIAEENLTLPEVQKRASELGPQGMLADTTEMLKLRAEQIANEAVPARSSVVSALKTRGKGASDRIGSAFDDALGPKPNVKQALDDMTNSTKKMANELYGKAKAAAKPVNTTKLIEDIDRELYSDIETAVQARSAPTPDTLDKEMMWLMGRLTGKGGEGKGVTQLVDYDKLHRLQQDIREKARSYSIKGDKYVAGKLFGAHKKLLEALDESTTVDVGGVPTSLYNEARKQFADDKAVEEAFDLGRQIFSSKNHPDFINAQIAEMPTAERDALKFGVRAAVDEAMGRVKNSSLKGRELLASDFNERKVLDVLGADEGKKLVDSLLAEQAMAATQNQALGNSATARRMSANPFKAERAPREWSLLSSVDPVRWAGKGVDAVQDAIGASKASSLASDMAPLLTATGAERDAILQALEAVQGRLGTSSAVGTIAEDLVRDAIIRGGAGSNADIGNDIRRLITGGGNPLELTVYGDSK